MLIYASLGGRASQERVRKFQWSEQGAAPVNPSVCPVPGCTRPHRSEQEIESQRLRHQHRYECGAAGILPVDKPIHDGLFTSRQLDTWLILTCAMPAGWPEVRPPVGRDLSCHLLTPAFAARKLHQNRVGRTGSGLERSAGGRAVRIAPGACGDQLGTSLASPGVSRETEQ